MNVVFGQHASVRRSCEDLETYIGGGIGKGMDEVDKGVEEKRG